MKDFPFENNLIHETSPYLVQHAHNPVNWYAWGEEAFQMAKEQNKPIFVSIGYSTCHWCHRMAKECFEDEEVAALLNRDFISIKVDREERPDIDQIFMNVCQMLTGTGGWPLHVFLTPEQLPFYAGTYFPKHTQGKQAGMLAILPYLKDVYEKQPDRVKQIGKGLKQGLIEQSMTEPVEREPSIVDNAYETLAQHFDVENGGFGGAPKFPNVAQLHYLMRYGQLRHNQHAIHLVEKTLNQLYKGGIYDHLGGGFSRYATDEKWLVPHFEKMLYDQAQLMMAYAEGYQLIEKPLYKQIIEETFSFLQREMKDESGSYYSAIDADSEGREGAYYLWDAQAIPSDVAQQYGVSGKAHLDGQYILNLIDNEHFDTVSANFKEQRRQLLARRQQRQYPHVDKKLLTGWNALLVTAFAKAGAAIQNEEMVSEAEALMVVLEKQHMVDGRLLMTARSKGLAFLDDYSYMLWAYNELYQVTQQQHYLKKAKSITQWIIQHFSDETEGFTIASDEHEQLLVNQKSALDNALPPGNGVLANEFYRLSRFDHDIELEAIALKQLTVFSKDLMAYPTSSLMLLQLELLQQARGQSFELFGQSDKIITLLQRQFRPFDVWTSTKAPQFSMQLCEGNRCLAIMRDIEEAQQIILSKKVDFL